MYITKGLQLRLVAQDPETIATAALVAAAAVDGVAGSPRAQSPDSRAAAALVAAAVV
jgi:hypothetical protein